MKHYIIVLFAAAMLCSCTEHYLPEQIDIIELGATKKVLTLPDEEYGEDSFEIYANCDWEWKQISGNEWLTVEYVKPIEDKPQRYTLHFSYYSNKGYPRSAGIVLFKDNRYDTLQVRQRGLIEHSINVKALSSGVIPAEGGSYSVIVETDVPARDLNVAASEAEQFSELYYSGHRLYFTIKPATERDKKPYVLTVYMIDGWGERLEGFTTVYQAPKQ